MNNSSINKIKIDFNKSSGSYIFDLNTNKKYLDMMGMYSTLAVGYNNNEVFSDIDFALLSSVFKNKITNCEINSNLLEDFVKTFHTHLDINGKFPKSYFCPTGALAIEASIKTALRYKNIDNPRILSFKGSFHGVYGFGGILTDRFDSVSPRLKGFPGGNFNTLNPYYDEYRSGHLNENSFEKYLIDLENEFVKDTNLAAVIIEPIQCTYGDHYIDSRYILKVREMCDRFDIPLIFDEIQTGFFTSGRRWYSDVLNIYPDILVFGKKLQVAGILINQKCTKIFEIPSTLEATWDSDLLDMFRSKIIIEFLVKKDLEVIINENSDLLKDEFSKLNEIKNYRSAGYLIAFDLENRIKRDSFVKNLKENGVLCNPTREKTIRFRPHLLASKLDFEELILKVKKSLKELAL